MKTTTQIKNQCAIVYDADCIQDPSELLFDPGYWVRSDRVEGEAPGRGSALFIDAPFGKAVLRRYLRGGWPARISRDGYFFTGVQQSRPFREFDLLRRLVGAGLPVPSPLAAMCLRQGLFYRGALLTRRLEDVVPLASLLGREPASEGVWEAVGKCIARFHAAGVKHADLNARNIVCRPGSGEVFLLDFDRSAFHPGKTVDGRLNLSRLHRSLAKLWPVDSHVDLPDCWQSLVDAYHG